MKQDIIKRSFFAMAGAIAFSATAADYFVSPDGQQLLLASGVHYTADQIPVAKALTIRGLGATPEAVIIRNTTTTPDSYYGFG